MHFPCKVGVRFLKGGANNDWHQEMKKKSFDYQQKRYVLKKLLAKYSL